MEKCKNKNCSGITIDVNIMEFEIMKEFIALTAKLMSQIETNEFTDKNGNCLQHNNDYIALMEFIEECLPE